MKKFVALFLVIGIFASFGFLSANAVESVNTETVRQPLSDEELDNLAAKAFPEYAERILNPQISSATSSSRSNVKVIEETRQISETESITYIEYADGRGSIVFVTDVYEGSTSTGSNSTTKVLDFQIRHVFISGSMYISGFTYTIVNSGYDYINSVGTFTTSDGAATPSVSRLKETSSANAQVFYTYTFEMTTGGDYLQGGSVPCTFQILAGDDAISYGAY